MMMVVVHSMGSAPAVAQHLRWSLESMAYYDHLRGYTSSSLGRLGFTLQENCLMGRLDVEARTDMRMQATMRGSW